MADVREVCENQTGISSHNTASAQSSAEEAVAQNQEDEANQAGQQQQAQQQNYWSIAKGFVIRALIIYFISSMFRRGRAPTDGQTGSGNAPKPGTNIMQKNTLLDMYVYVSEEEFLTKFDNPFWTLTDIKYGDWYDGPKGDGSFVHYGEIEASEAVQNNGSVYIHVYFVKNGKSPDPSKKGRYSKRFTFSRSKMLNKFKKKRYHKRKNLLTGVSDQSQEDLQKAENGTIEVISHWHPNLTLNLVDDHTPWTQGSVPKPLDDYIQFEPVSGNYYPIIYVNDYWNMLSEYQPINETTPILNLTVTYSPISLFKWQMYAAQSMKNKWTSILGEGMMDDADDAEQDTLKQAMLETNPYLLGLTIVISIVHSIFEFLAFKNDIQFWNSRKSLEGLSVRSVFFNVFQSVVVLLYVLDNETNTVVRISVFVGLAIEIWKIPKVVNIKVDREAKILGILPRVWYEDKGTYVESSTKQYDQLAFKYLSWLLFPLLGAYAVYSVVYLEHKGWYSWVLSMLYGYLLTFGFIMMTPQLFINYKLKSVAHLPWRMLTYKALNTFIDDIFAFVIKMPTMYRIGCFRDDIVFFIFLYQKWVYPIDPKRVNEFGTTGEDHVNLANSATPADDVNNVNKPLEDKKKD